MLKKYLVLGSGFGLYGYLPALIKLKKKVYLPIKYKNFLLKRKDLKKYLLSVNFIKDVNLSMFDFIIFARRPKDQYNFVKNLQHSTFLFLEKPLSETPLKAEKLINIIKKKKIKFAVAYIFFFTSWFKKLLILKKKDEVTIIWNFKSKTFSFNNWKTNHNDGGGIISFYGIHFLALFSYLKFDCISSFVFKLRNVENEWNSKFEKKKININLKLNISSKEIFMIYINKKLIYKSLTPFGNKKNKEDIRVNFLKLYINNKNFISINKQSQIIKMWKHVKNVTKIIN